MDRIRVLGLEVYGHHGITPQEQAVGRPFSIDVEVALDLQAAGRDDDLTATVDYSSICSLVAQVNDAGPYHLLEAFAQRIANEVLIRFPAREVIVRVRKPHPPVGMVVQAAEVEITRASEAQHPEFRPLGRTGG
jgi:dihydroneopterin aldolase